MKMKIELDLTPEEARRMMGLPDVSGLHAKMLSELEKRMKAAMDSRDPEAMLRAWMPLSSGSVSGFGNQAFEQFQKFLWESAKKAGTPKAKV